MRRPSLLCVLITSLVVVAGPARAGAGDKQLHITWVDSEGGGSTLIVTPAGESVLIDTGNPGGRDSQRIIKAAKEAGLDHLDHVVITHYHVDHFGGAAEVAQSLPIKHLWDNGAFSQGRERPTEAYLGFAVGERHVIEIGQELPLKQAEGTPAVHLKCLGARQQTIDAPAGAAENPLAKEKEPTHKSRDLTDNANSVVLLLSVGEFRFFDGGDLTWNNELKLVYPVNLVGTVDVYQSDHHGLDVSNHPLLVASLSPTVTVFNNGAKKGCMPEAFAAVKAVGTNQAIYQMHRNLRPDGDKTNTSAEYIANAEEACEGSTIKLTLAADGKSYTVRVPSTKNERTFAVRGR